MNDKKNVVYIENLDLCDFSKLNLIRKEVSGKYKVDMMCELIDEENKSAALLYNNHTEAKFLADALDKNGITDYSFQSNNWYNEKLAETGMSRRVKSIVDVF